MRTLIASLLAGFLLTACQQAATTDATALLNRDWTLVERAGTAIPLPKPPTLRLDAAEQRAGGHGGCNRYAGGYVLTRDQLTFTRMAGTRMACMQGMDVEDKYLADLGRVTHWRLVDGRLELRAGDQVLLVFASPAAP
ncbi:MAG: META domain-containing protein [Moraxellaceae bacterium]